MQDENFWTLFRHVAKRAGCELKALFNFDRPGTGIRATSPSGEQNCFRLLSISASDSEDDWPAKVVDTYSRGNDRVVTYAGTKSWPFSPQIYWTAETIEVGGRAIQAFSLVVSIQTDRLDTHPRIVVRSSLPADEVLLVSVVGDDMLVDSHGEGVQSFDPRTSACGLVWRLPGDELSYAEVIPTSDFHQLSIERADGAIGSRWELFAEFLEKGVIRRARLQSMFVPREDDVQRVAECCQSIGRRPLPLTT